MQLRLTKLSAKMFTVLAISLSQGEEARAAPPYSYAQQLLKFDRNGNGKLDDFELATMHAKEEPSEQPLAGLPLICEGEVHGGGGSDAAQEESSAQEHAAGHPARQQWRWRRQPPQAPGNPAEHQQEEEPARETAEGYPAVAPRVQMPVLPRSVGLSKAVQYRLQANAQQPHPVRYRQAAVFGATIGLSKRQPARFRPVQSSCAGCTGYTLSIGY